MPWTQRAARTRGAIRVLAACGRAVAVLAACGLALGPPTRPGLAAMGRAHTRRAAPASGLCAWPVASIGQRLFGNAALIDTAATYLTMGFGYYRGTALRIRGLFPHARYMSFTVYTPGAGGAVSDQLADQFIAPDRGSVNPFRPNADRAARNRSYTLYVRQGPAPAHGRAPNTLYTGAYHQVYVLYRVYDPDRGADVYGGVPEPGVAIVGARSGAAGYSRSLSACAAPRAMWWKSGTTVGPTMQWQRVGVAGGHGGNSDNIYLAIHLTRSGARTYTLRFKAPTFPNTNQGRPITGKEDVRYWSVCQYDMATEKVIACLHDYQARSQNGYVTVELTTSTPQATSEAAPGVNWLPFGDGQNGLLLYRQLLPSPSFGGSLLRVAPGASQDAVKRALGVYYPAMTLSGAPR